MSIFNIYQNCTGLLSITIPNSVSTIGASAFYKCSGLISVSIQNGVKIIGDNAFNQCQGLESIVIPSSVTELYPFAFANCNNLSFVKVYHSTPLKLWGETFSNCDNAKLYVPIGSKYAYKYADYWKEFKNILEFDATGIDEIAKQSSNEVEGSENDKAMIFTIDGKRVDNLKKGLNVIRMKDGTMRKVVVK